MKIVVVTAAQDVITYLKTQDKLSSCLFVHYSHPLKALDNLSEIDPDLIVWNADDYPRHWKLCTAFCPIRPAGEVAALILVSESGLSEEEEKKAQALDIADIVDDGFFGDKLVGMIERRLPQGEANRSIQGVSPAYLVRDSAEWPQGTGSLILIHPDIQQMIIGTIAESDGRSLSVHFANAADLALFKPELYVDRATITIGSVSREAILKTIATGQADRVRFLILHLADLKTG